MVGLMLILTLPMILVGKSVLRQYGAYIYTPPAITFENIPVYRECIKFAKNHNEDKTLVLGVGDRVVVDGVYYMLSKGNSFERNRAKKAFSEQDILVMESLCHRLSHVKCVQFQRDDDMLVFYKAANVFPATGAGVVYSLSGENPNEIDSEVLNANKPFVKIGGDWYMSKHLMLAGPRGDIHVSIPESWIDHSLNTEGIAIENEMAVVPTKNCTGLNK